MSRFNPRWLQGKTVARVEMNASREGEGHQVVMHRPTIHFTDGSCLSFLVEEHPEGAEYGVGFIYVRARTAPKKKRAPQLGGGGTR